MTDAASSNPTKPEFKSWFDAWRSCTQDVLVQVSGQPTVFETASEPFAAGDSDLRYTVAVSGAVQGEMGLRVSESSALRLARKFVGEPESPAGEQGTSLSDESREALEELLRQIGGLVATTIGGSIGGPVQLQLSRAEVPWTWTSDHLATLRTRDEAGTEIALEIRISPALAAALSARAEAAVAPPSTAASPSASAPPAAAATASSTDVPLPPPEAEAVPDPPASGYRRLLDVGLGVKLRFGTRRMLLRDVLALSSGLVVELDNELNSPVDLLLEGRVIARGEVVVIDGKYGLRVSEVIDSSPLAAMRLN